MGLDANAVRCLLHARMLGVDFARTATIGRQSLLLGRRDLKTCLAEFGDPLDEESIHLILTGRDGYAEKLLGYLGAGHVDSFDHSSYEGATRLQDMNQPISGELAGQYSVVLDSGSLEHVFNFPTAIKNCMEMVAAGGHYIGITPANNFLGHGFYQFSPELFYSVFTPENGFEVGSLVAFEDRPRARWYAVKDPREAGERVTLFNSRPVYLFVVAKRIAAVPIFETPPQQSDYVSIWRRHEEGPRAAPSEESFYGRIKSRIPNSVKHSLKVALRRRSVCRRPGFDPRFFRRIDPTANRQPASTME